MAVIAEALFNELMREASRFARAGELQRARAAYLEACRTRPLRAEPLYEIARQFRLEGRLELAYLFARRAAEVPLPESEPDLAADIYHWRARDELAICAFQTGRYEQAVGLMSGLLELRDVPARERMRLERDVERCRQWTAGKRGEYPAGLVEALTERIDASRAAEPEVTVTITSCQRPDLLERTINSFLRCCTDIERIGRWLCIDNGTAEGERTRFRERYPFFEYVPADYWHADAMNHLMESVVSPFWLHLEDDFQFLARKPYVGHGIAVLAADPAIAQVTFNRNYAELLEHQTIGGYVRRTADGVRYRVHELINPGTPEWDHLVLTLTHTPQALAPARWPHFTLRPSLMRTAAMRSVGRFRSEPGRDFEIEFARRYVAAGFKTAFFDEITSVHTGRLTHPRGSNEGRVSAYDLLESQQP